MERTIELEGLRRRLIERRRMLVETHGTVEGELQALRAEDRNPEYEESAQRKLADDVLTTLSESERREVLQIDGALSRMDEGSYGVCVDCGQAIPVDRLRALPFTLRCEDDQEAREKALRGNTPRPSL
jgi:DnaK suppressor protein